MSIDTSPKTMPDGWKTSTIGEVCKVVSGSTPKTNVSEYWGGDIPWLTPNDLSKNRSKVVNKGERSITQKGFESCSTQMVPEGSVLFTSRAPIGYVAIAATPMCTNQGFKSAIPSEDIGAEFLYWQLQYLTDDIRSRASGTTFLEISGRGFAATNIVLPTLKEQEKIVELLEEQISRLDAAIVSVRAARKKAARFRRSLLHAAFTGILTGHFTSDGEMPPRWSSGSLGEFCEMYQPKTISTKELIEDGEFPVFGANGQIGFYDKYNHEDSEVTVTCRGATCGTVNVIPGKSWITGNAMVVRPINNCMSKPLLSYQLQSLDFTQVITGTAQPQITRTTLTEIKVVLPPSDEQSTIVQKLEEQLSRLDVALKIADAIEGKASAMRRSLLHAAFTGELTKEWREGAHV